MEAHLTAQERKKEEDIIYATRTPLFMRSHAQHLTAACPWPSLLETRKVVPADTAFADLRRPRRNAGQWLDVIAGKKKKYGRTSGPEDARTTGGNRYQAQLRSTNPYYT